MASTKWEGLWAQVRSGVYAGKVIKKSDIPKYTRLIVMHNRYWKKENNTPRYVYCFADSEGYEDKCIDLRIDEGRPHKEDGTYYDEDGERLYTKDEVRKIINGTVEDVEYGISDPYDILPEDFV